MIYTFERKIGEVSNEFKVDGTIYEIKEMLSFLNHEKDIEINRDSNKNE